MRRSESQERLTEQPQEEPNREAASQPEVEFRGERRPVQQPDQQSTSSEIAFDPDLLLVNGCHQIMSLFVPVSLCMLFVVIISCTVPFFSTKNADIVSQVYGTGGGDGSSGTTAGQGVIVALIIMGIIILATIMIVLCFKFGCIKFIKGYVFVAGCSLLFFFSSMFFAAMCNSMNIFVDYITFALFIWNFGLIGMFSFFWKSPLLAQQAYSIFIAAQVALIFNMFLPWWTTWFLLVFLALWDLFAVLCPQGPLRILVRHLQENQEPFPPIMVYSTAAGIAYMADVPHATTSSNDSNQTHSIAAAPAAEQTQAQTQEQAAAQTQEEAEAPAQAQEPTAAVNSNNEEDDGGFQSHVQNTHRAERLAARQDDADFTASGRARSALSALNNANEEAQQPEVQVSNVSRNLREIHREVLSREDRGVKLGLGDFIFYSLLIAKASQTQDWSTILAVFVAILIGMCSTLLLLAIRGHALPALPISIAFGLVFYFCTSQIITPFSNSLAVNQAFI